MVISCDYSLQYVYRHRIFLLNSVLSPLGLIGVHWDWCHRISGWFVGQRWATHAHSHHEIWRWSSYCYYYEFICVYIYTTQHIHVHTLHISHHGWDFSRERQSDTLPPSLPPPKLGLNDELALSQQLHSIISWSPAPSMVLKISIFPSWIYFLQKSLDNV